jgi:ribosomal protein S8E
MFNSSEFSSNTNHELESNIAKIFGAALESTHSSLMAASKSDNFLPTIAPIFNVSGDLNRLQALSDSWASGDFSQLPTIRVLPSDSMNGANGAFSELTRTIYLSSGYLSQGFSNPDILTGGVTSTLLEEIGHFVDTLVNPGADTVGDEGALFAVTLMGLPLSDAENLLIHQEDDHGFVTIDGKAIAVEQSFTDIAGNNLSGAQNLRASVTIAETAFVTIAATDASAAETTTGVIANPGTFTLTRTGNLAKALTVNYTLAGTASKGIDYSNLTGTVGFAAGASTATVKVTPTDDTLAEKSETAILTLGTGTGYTLGSTTTATITIADNETAFVTIAATDASAAETTTGVIANPGTFTLTRTGNLAKALTVNYTLAGTASKGIDYSNLTGTVGFAAGASTATVKVTPTDDTLAEKSETAVLTLGTGTGYTLGSTTTATITIADNDPRLKLHEGFPEYEELIRAIRFQNLSLAFDSLYS